MQYGLIVWGGASQASLKPVITQQKKAIRLINKASYNAHTADLFKSSEILSISNTFILQELKVVHCFYHKYLSKSVTDKLQTPAHGYLVRSSDKIRCNRLVKGQSIWQNLSREEKSFEWPRLAKTIKRALQEYGVQT